MIYSEIGEFYVIYYKHNNNNRLFSFNDPTNLEKDGIKILLKDNY